MKSKKIYEALLRKGKKGKDTKRQRRRWGSDRIRGDCPEPTRGLF